MEPLACLITEPGLYMGSQWFYLTHSETRLDLYWKLPPEAMSRWPGSSYLGIREYEYNAALVQIRANTRVSVMAVGKMISKDIYKVPKSNIKPLKSN